MQWMMLQQQKPKDYVIATGRSETVRQFLEICSIQLGWSKSSNSHGILWEGSGINEIGRRADTGEIVIRIDKRYFRPTEVEQLLGDSSKAKKELGWEPKLTLEEIVSEMISSDINEAKKELILKNEGFNLSNSIETIPEIMNEN